MPDTWEEVDPLPVVVDGLGPAVARLRHLDPVTAELVRLRGARQHQCRLCRSRRDREALALGADEATFDAIDHHATSRTLDEGQRAALALVDAVIWTPARIAPEVAAAVRVRFTDAQVVELVLDVVRNAANKVAVALGADQPNVTEGTELFELDAQGIPQTVGPHP